MQSMRSTFGASFKPFGSTPRSDFAMTSAPRPFTTPGGSALWTQPVFQTTQTLSRASHTGKVFAPPPTWKGGFPRAPVAQTSKKEFASSFKSTFSSPRSPSSPSHKNPLRERSGAAGKDIVSPSQSLRDGAPMRGVSSFPYDPQQSQYIDDFAPIVASRIAHPYQGITLTNADWISFNVITGTAYSTPGVQSSEYKRSFNGASLRKPFGAPGLRSEEMITVGQCPVVGRSV